MMTPEAFFAFTQASKKYEAQARHFEALILGLRELIESGKVPSLASEGPDRRGFRFRFLGESYILRHSFTKMEGGQPNTGTITLHALDGMDDRQSSVRKQLPMNHYGEIVIQYRPDALFAEHGAESIFFELFTN